MQFDVVTLFPRMFEAVTRWGVTGRAEEANRYNLVLWNPREFAAGPHRSVDDRPYGGGPGMVMMVEPLEKSVQAARQRQRSQGLGRPKVVFLSPQGRLLDHRIVRRLAQEPGLVLVAGRYEGVDERFIEREVDEEISIGDYVLSGGELAAMVLMDCVIRQLEGVLGHGESAAQDSFFDGLLDWPHYTRPENYRGAEVPPVLLSGNHREIEHWRMKQALGRTWRRRPELLETASLTEAQLTVLEEFKKEQALLRSKSS